MAALYTRGGLSLPLPLIPFAGNDFYSARNHVNFPVVTSPLVGQRFQPHPGHGGTLSQARKHANTGLTKGGR